MPKQRFGSCNSNWILFFLGFGQILSLCRESIGRLHMVGLWNGTVWLVHVQQLSIWCVCLGVGSNPRLFKSVVNLHCSVDLGGIFRGFHAVHRTDFFIYFYLFHHPFFLSFANKYVTFGKYPSVPQCWFCLSDLTHPPIIWTMSSMVEH